MNTTYPPVLCPGAKLEIDNRRAAYSLWNTDWRFRHPIIRNVFLATLIEKRYDLVYSTNRRHKEIPTWLERGINLLPKMFGVTEDLLWKTKAGAFSGEWRRTTRKEIRLATGGDFSEWEMTKLLQCLVKFGILHRDHVKREKVIVGILLWLDAIRMTEFIREAHEFAIEHHLIKSQQDRAKINVDCDDEKSPKTEASATGGVCGANTGNYLLYCTRQAAGVGTSTFEEEIENRIIPGGAGVDDLSYFSFTGNPVAPPRAHGSPGIVQPTTGDPGAPAPEGFSVSPSLDPSSARQILVSPETAKVLALLRNMFPSYSFPSRRIKQVERHVHARLPAYRMTPDRLQRYLVAQQSADSDEWQFNVKELEFFLARWVPILKHLLERETVLSAEEAQGALDTSSEALFAEVQEQGTIIDEQAKRFSFDPIQYAIDYPNPIFGPVGIISRLVLIRDYNVDMLPALAKLSPELRNSLIDHPRHYLLLREKIPLREWARLNDQEHRRLMHAAKNQYRESYRRVAVHDMHKPLKPKQKDRSPDEN